MNKHETKLQVIFSGDYEYTVPAANPKIHKGICVVDIAGYDNGVHCVIMAEHKNNQGISVTNACDRIATQLYTRYLANVRCERVVWLEHCPATRMHKAHMDLIQFRHEEPRPGAIVFSNPQWKRFIEAQRIVHAEFLKTYGYILKELGNAHMIFAVEDKHDHSWRIWANQEGFFIISANPSAVLPDFILDVNGVIGTLRQNQQFFASGDDLGEQFTTALMKGFLNKGL